MLSRLLVRFVSSTFSGAVTVEDVPALVFADDLKASLLGMSYLGRLSRLEATREGLTLTR